MISSCLAQRNRSPTQRARRSVITLEHSSWMMADLPADMGELALQVTRRGDAVEVRYGVADGDLELAGMVYLPPDGQVLAGEMCAAPEGSAAAPSPRAALARLHSPA
jgi:regulation of enolase protein 1 (concanavalin A-like superfamily)